MKVSKNSEPQVDWKGMCVCMYAYNCICIQISTYANMDRPGYNMAQHACQINCQTGYSHSSQSNQPSHWLPSVKVTVHSHVNEMQTRNQHAHDRHHHCLSAHTKLTVRKHLGDPQLPFFLCKGTPTLTSCAEELGTSGNTFLTTVINRNWHHIALPVLHTSLTQVSTNAGRSGVAACTH